MKILISIFCQLLFFFFVCFFIMDSELKNDRYASTECEETSGAMEALNFWTQSRSYPATDIPSSKFIDSYSYVLKEREQLFKSLSSYPLWESLGPLNVTGRTISVAVNPRNTNTVYVGSASGGLWRSHTGGSGSNWKRITTGYPVLGVKAIAIDSVDTNSVYIGTGEVYRYHGTHGGVAIRTTRGSYGIGILKTTDDGRTWTKSLDWTSNQERGVQAIKINPFNHNTIFAATTEGIYKSTNAGTSWRNVFPVLMAQDILINSSDSTRVLITCGNFSSPQAGFYISLESGEPDTWFQLTSLPSFSGKSVLESFKSDPEVVFASIADSTTGVGAIYKSTSFGSSWDLVTNSNPIYGVQGWYSHIVAVHPWDQNQFFHGGVPLTKTTDGGIFFTYDQSVHSDIHAHAHSPSDANTIYITNDAGIVKSTDWGLLFDDVSYGMQTTQFYNGFVNAPYDSTFAFGQMQDHIPGYAYTGSVDWSEINIDEVGWSAIDPINENNIYAMAREGSSIYKSTDRGGSFFTIGLPGIGAWNSPLVISPSNPNVLYTGKNKILKSTDFGFSWLAVNNNLTLDGNLPLAMAVSQNSPDTVYVGTVPSLIRGHIYCTTNGGTSWIDITGMLPDRYPMDIAIDPYDASIVYVAFGGYGTGHVFKSTNSGSSWSDITGSLPDVHATALVVDPFNHNHVYLGNDIGIFITTDAGNSWAPFMEGLPEAILISDLGICYANKSLRASTHGNGLYQCKLYSSTTGVDDEKRIIPNEISLFQNYPNPFNPSTQVKYRLSMERFVQLKVYDASGREVTTLISKLQPAGEHEVKFESNNLSSGIYFYSLEIENSRITKKMILIR